MKKLFITLNCALCIALGALAQNVTITPIVTDDDATLSGISNNGKWAVGYAFDNSDNAANNINASVWNLETGERTVLTPSEEGPAEANCINNDGTVIGGAYLGEPAYYTNGKWHVLGLLDGYTIGVVKSMTILGADTIFVGYVMNDNSGTACEAVKWVNGLCDWVNPDDFVYDKYGEEAKVNTCWEISEDGKTILGSMEFNAKPHQSAFIATEDDIYLIDTKTDKNYNMSFIFAPKLSPNGKYVAGSFWDVVYEAGDTIPVKDMYQPCFYDVENKRLQIIECDFEAGAYDVDNNGNLYICSPVETNPIRQGYVLRNGELVELETILLEKGATQEQIDAASAPTSEEYSNKLGTIIAVSIDGKTIIGCAGECKKYNWVVKLQESIFVGVNNISYNDLAAYYSAGNIVLSGMVDAIEVYNMNGALVMKQDVNSAFVPAQLEGGMYIVKMYNNTTNSVCSSKIVIK